MIIPCGKCDGDSELLVAQLAIKSMAEFHFHIAAVRRSFVLLNAGVAGAGAKKDRIDN